MLLLWFYSLITFLLFLAEFAVLAFFAAGTVARLYRRSRAEHILLVVTLFIFYMIPSMAIAGSCDLLAFPAIVSIATAIAYAAYAVAKRFPVQPIPAAPPSPRINDALVGIILGLFLLMIQFCSLEHAGTDTFFYHLYFPGMWLANHSLSRIPVPGFTCEYYPCYAELMFGFFMAPFKSADTAVFLQPIAFLSSLFALFALGREMNLRDEVPLAAAALLFFTCMLANNATMAYTDVLNGALFLDGLVLLIIGLRRHDPLVSSIAGALLGVSSAIKLTGLFLSPILALFFFIYFFLADRESLRKCWPAIPAAFLFAAPCYLINWFQTGNPFYPVRVSFAGIPVFSAGLDFERHAVGLSSDVFPFFFGNADWGMNFTGGILWGALPFAAALSCLLRRSLLPRMERLLFLLLSIMMVMLFILQLLIYPAIAEARQFIPWIMASSLLLLPVLAGIPAKFLVPVAIVLSFALYYTRMLLVPWRPYAVFAFFGAAVYTIPRRWHRIALIVLGSLMIPIIPLLFAARISSIRNDGNLYTGPELNEALKIVRQYFIERGPATIAVTGNLFSYAFMEDMDGNRVISIPINQENSLAPHKFSSFADMRSNPVPDEVWISRLLDAQVDFVLISSLHDEERLPNQDYEAEVMARHPDIFGECMSEDNTLLYYVRHPKTP